MRILTGKHCQFVIAEVTYIFRASAFVYFDRDKSLGINVTP